MNELIRVLHLDDKPAFAELTATFLEREENCLTVETEHSASDGLDRLREGDIHCVVSDYDMPTQDGIEFLRTVRREFPSLPFILFTGKGSEEVASEAITEGVTDYLQKGAGTSQYEILANRIINSVEQRRARDAVAETEQRLQSLTENTNDILWMFTGDWSELLFVNSPYEEIWGGSIDDLRVNPLSFMQNIHPDDRELVRQSMEQLSAGEPVEEEYRVNADEDFGRWVWIQAEPVFDDDGEVSQVVGFARDVTDRTEHKHELQRYESMVEASGDPIYTLDSEGRFTTVNTAFVELTGYSAESLIGNHASEVMDDAHVARGEQLIKSLLSSSKDNGTFELTLVTATGERIACENHLALLPFVGDFRGTVGVLRDISERVTQAQHLRDERDLLDEFASVVSHDLRSPLAVASGRLALAQEECDSDHLDTVERAHDRIEGLVRDLLTLAQEGDGIGETEPVELAETATRSWETVAMGDATIAIETEQTVEADVGRLQQLLENLFRNAIQHGSDDVTVTVGDVEGGFYVQDDGPGIPNELGCQIFDAGYTTSPDGSGLGLNIVREVACAHGWEVRLSPTSGDGARFEITGC
ncbi:MULTISPECIES: PAS domain S-box protein [Haloferax]|uniref:histidine kinase n=1 Tax=Haloferax marinum TaxID=2666143 RepID=A0A6A8G8M0_9EURY|nr:MULTISPECIES: PAS domain S-box protein [Haloferax]KAB1198027.1 PAS domain S-box protein [Haloferax sp. CBA1150]MRW97095.1 PAS domain S-box protein [Haloferax marinum]